MIEQPPLWHGRFPITGDGRVSADAAAWFIGVSPGTLRNWRCLCKGLPWVRIPGVGPTYFIADLQAFIDSHRVLPATRHGRERARVIR